MNPQLLVPCVSGKCGVQSHIIGSSEQKNCANGMGSPAPAQKPRDLTPRTTSFHPEHEVAAQKFLQASWNQQEALDLRIQEQTLGVKNPVRRLWEKVRYSARQRADRAWAKYDQSGVDDKLQKSFLRLLKSSHEARPTTRTGEAVKSMDNFRGTVFGGQYEGIQYIHHGKGFPLIRATQHTSAGPRHVSVRYEDEGISLKVYDPRDGKHLLTQYHDEQGILARQKSGEGRDYNREATQSLMDLLIHAQNERNWVNA